ncbi:MAG TPA: VCBS repeat-containing protein, partial [Actinomycetota bacterium]|nr:VCBS repeat-containing protein [Actinomycetota bacterium]
GIPHAVGVFRGREAGGFHPSVTTEADDIIRSVEVVDLNRDGSSDVFAGVGWMGAQAEQRAVLFPGAGDGTLGPPLELGLPPGRAVTAGDLLDGSAAVAIATAEEIQIHRSDADGVVRSERAIEAPGVTWLDAADLDADGTDELLAWSEEAQELSLFTATGERSWIHVSGGRSFRAADATGDGRAEILAGTGDGTVLVLDRDLDTIRTVAGSASDVHAVDAADLDGDGSPEVVSARAGVVEVAHADGRRTTTRSSDSPWTLLLHDVAGDPAVDVVIALPTMDAVEILVNDGSGGFAAPTRTVPTEVYSWYLDHGDFNGDGDADVLASQSDPFLNYQKPQAATVFLGDGGGGFQPSAELETTGAPVGTGVGDFDGDGDQDVLVGDQLGYLSQFFGAGDGTFGARQPGPGCLLPMNVATADLDADGYDDAAAICRNVGGIGPDQVITLFGSPVGLVRGQQLVLPNAWHGAIVRIGDVNGDGLRDLVVGSDMHNPPTCTDCFLYGFGKAVVTTFLGLPTGRAWEPVGREHPVTEAISDIAVADLDGDGRDEILASLPFAGEVRVTPVLSDGTFAQSYDVDTYARPGRIEIADLEDDGLLDLVLSHEQHSAVSVARGGPNGFGPPTAFMTNGRVRVVHAVDMSGDDRLDLLGGRIDAFDILLQR